MAEVTLDGLRKIYGGARVAHTAVHGIDLTIADGEFVVLVGPSGCGKSTILRMIAGLESISAGDLKIDGRRVNDVAPGERDIAMVFQTYALYPHMTVRENLAFALTLQGRPKADVDKRVQAAAAAMHIESMLARKPRALSGGERQRVALGRALVREPKVFLFDEPLSNLDARLRVEMRREIARLHRELSATMIYVTHDQVEAMTLGDRIVVLRDGRVQQVDVPSVLYNTPANLFVASFIGSPSMNFFEGALVKRAADAVDRGARDARSDGLEFMRDDSVRVSVPDGWRDRLRAHAGKPVTLGVRPEHLVIGGNSEEPAAMTMQVDLVEHLGNEAIVHGTAGGTPVTVRSAPGVAAAAGDRITLRVVSDHLHFFNTETGERVI